MTSRKRSSAIPGMLLHNLPRRAARFCLNVESFITRELRLDLAGRLVVAAYSGGADSKALLHVLLRLAPRLGFSLALAHLDHTIRAESGSEHEAAKALAVSLELPFFGRVCRVADMAGAVKCGLEEAGRRARHAFFYDIRHGHAAAILPKGTMQQAKAADVANGTNAPLSAQGLVTAPLLCHIAQGHQLNDLAEDVFMRLMRGAGWPALGGMAAVNAEFGVIRPLLYTSRADLEAFLQSLGLDWLDDPMNADPHYLRNRVRAVMLPMFMKENPAFLQHVADLHRMAGLDAELFRQWLEPLIGTGMTVSPQPLPRIPTGKDACGKMGGAAASRPTEEGKSIVLTADVLKTMPKALRMRAYKTCVDTLGPGQALLKNLLALDAAWQSGRGGATVQFPGDKAAVVRKGNIHFNLFIRT